MSEVKATRGKRRGKTDLKKGKNIGLLEQNKKKKGPIPMEPIPLQIFDNQ
jgi:hypothetical protein